MKEEALNFDPGIAVEEKFVGLGQSPSRSSFDRVDVSTKIDELQLA